MFPCKQPSEPSFGPILLDMIFWIFSNSGLKKVGVLLYLDISSFRNGKEQMGRSCSYIYILYILPFFLFMCICLNYYSSILKVKFIVVGVIVLCVSGSKEQKVSIHLCSVPTVLACICIASFFVICGM